MNDIGPSILLTLLVSHGFRAVPTCLGIQSVDNLGDCHGCMSNHMDVELLFHVLRGRRVVFLVAVASDVILDFCGHDLPMDDARTGPIVDWYCFFFFWLFLQLSRSVKVAIFNRFGDK